MVTFIRVPGLQVRQAGHTVWWRDVDESLISNFSVFPPVKPRSIRLTATAKRGGRPSRLRPSQRLVPTIGCSSLEPLHCIRNVHFAPSSSVIVPHDSTATRQRSRSNTESTRFNSILASQ